MSEISAYPLPIGWKEDRLENLIAESSNITYGVVQPGPEDESGVPFIRGGDIYNGIIVSVSTVNDDPITTLFDGMYCKDKDKRF